MTRMVTFLMLVAMLPNAALGADLQHHQFELSARKDVLAADVALHRSEVKPQRTRIMINGPECEMIEAAGCTNAIDGGSIVIVHECFKPMRQLICALLLAAQPGQ